MAGTQHQCARMTALCGRMTRFLCARMTRLQCAQMTRFQCAQMTRWPPGLYPNFSKWGRTSTAAASAVPSYGTAAVGCGASAAACAFWTWKAGIETTEQWRNRGSGMIWGHFIPNKMDSWGLIPRTSFRARCPIFCPEVMPPRNHWTDWELHLAMQHAHWETKTCIDDSDFASTIWDGSSQPCGCQRIVHHGTVCI